MNSFVIAKGFARIPLRMAAALSYLPLVGVAVTDRGGALGNACGPLTGLRIGVVGVFSRNAS